MNKDITLEEYTNKFNRIFADKEEKGFSQEVLTPLWKSLQRPGVQKTKTKKKEENIHQWRASRQML